MYTYAVCLKSDSYIGFDQQKSVKLDVKEAQVRTLFKPLGFQCFFVCVPPFVWASVCGCLFACFCVPVCATCQCTMVDNSQEYRV